MPRPRLIVFRGREQTIDAWCAELGIKRRTYEYRVHELGLRAQDALEMGPPDAHRQPIKYGGKEYPTIRALCSDLGLPYWRTRDRIRHRGWTIERAVQAPKQRGGRR